MSNTKKFPYYIIPDDGTQEQLIKFVENELQFTNRGSAIPQNLSTLRYVVLFSDQTFRWLIGTANKDINTLHFRKDRKELVYRLNRFMGDSYKVPEFIKIPLQGEQQLELTKIFKYFLEIKKYEGIQQIIVDVLENNEYPVFLQSELNKYIRIYETEYTLRDGQEMIEYLVDKKEKAKNVREMNSYQQEIDRINKELTDLMAVSDTVIKTVSTASDNAKLRAEDFRNKIREDTSLLLPDTDFSAKAFPSINNSHYVMGVDPATNDSFSTYVTATTNTDDNELSYKKISSAIKKFS